MISTESVPAVILPEPLVLPGIVLYSEAVTVSALNRPSLVMLTLPLKKSTAWARGESWK